jgi:hypothetical protein
VSVPATIRNNNPGAIWPAPICEKWGAYEHEQLTDAQRNQMAIFPSKVSGAAAQFDLLSRSYVGMTVEAALEKWSGGNHVDTYVQRVCRATGLHPADILTARYIRTAKTGIRLARAMARHETGWDLGEYPMTTAEWREAHDLALGSAAAIPAADNANMLGEAVAEWARQQIGKAEKPGAGNYQHMDDWYRIIGLRPREDDATPWCELFALAAWRNGGAIIAAADDPNILLARNHLRLGTEVPKGQPEDLRRGDATVWPRGPYPYGHVGICIDVDYEAQTVTYAEGNVGNRVTKKTYTYDDIRDRSLGSRRPQSSKALPNGLKPIWTTVKDSPSLRSLVNGIVTGLSALGAWIGTAFGVAPDAVDNAEQVVNTTQRATDLLSISMLPGALTVLALCCMLFTFLRGVAQRRQETKPAVDGFALTLDAEPLPPARPRKKRGAVKTKSKVKAKTQKRKVRNAR